MMLSKIINPHYKFINDYESILLKAIYNFGKEGGFIAFGYSCINNLYLDLIPKNEWAFLEIDKNNETAYCEEREYRSIKFVLSEQLKEQLTPDEIDEFNLSVNEKIESELISVELSKEDAKESKMELDNVQESVDSTPRKKLKPLIRETNIGLLLLYEIFKHFNVSYLDELPAKTAWGKIISGEFSSEHIKDVTETNTTIILIDKTKLSKSDFSEKYRKRFEVE